MQGRNYRAHLIANPNAAHVRRIRALHGRDARERAGLFYTEGIRFVLKAVQHGAPIKTLVVAPELLTSPLARRLVAEQRRAGVAVLHVTAEVFRGLSHGAEPQGVGVMVRQRWTPLERARPDDGLCWVALERVQSPGNLGTIIRTCEAVGAAGLILLGDAVDPYDPAAVRATMGSLFGQRLVRTTLPALVAWVQRHCGLLAGTSPAAATDYRAVAYRPPLVLFMGWERRGLSPTQQAACDVLVRIPMAGDTDSLNLAVATGVLLYEVFRQRRATG